jgi:omega-6 fatty acid desaturase (delta-12 desaturase)
MVAMTGAEGAGDMFAWDRRLDKYRTPRTLRAVVELAITAAPFVLIWYAMYWSVMHGQIGLYCLLLLPAVGFLVRLFLIQHDCGHQAFLKNRMANDWIGRTISVLTLTPYDHWRRTHATHHATSGRLDRRGVGDIDTLTVAEYQARTRATRFRYRLYRNPLVMFAFGPFLIFVLQNRFPLGFVRSGWRPWASTMGLNVALLVAGTLLISAVGIKPFLLVHTPIMLLSAAVGGWLFYVQHQFETTYWAEGPNWNVRTASLHGSSHYDLPPILRWFTANIGVHHVHHLASRIPYYRLPDVLNDYPELRGTGRLTFLQSFKCVRLALWDEDNRRLVSFRDIDRRWRQRSSGAMRVPAGSTAPASTATNSTDSI